MKINTNYKEAPYESFIFCKTAYFLLK